MQPDSTAPSWLMSLRAHPEVDLIARGVNGVDLERMTTTWRTMSWGLLLPDYEAEFIIDEHVLGVRPGTITIFPPAAACAARFTGRSEQLHVFFHLAAGRGDEISIPSLTDLGADTERVRALLETALASFPMEPQATARILYDILRELSASQTPPPVLATVHPAVRAAVALIESNLHEQIEVTQIAAQVGLSDRQLRSHFRRQFDTTIVAYIRRRRAERARKLLLVTDLPAKSVAAQIGIVDLQRFNKLIRREFGVSPRTLRTAGGSQWSGGDNPPS